MKEAKKEKDEVNTAASLALAPRKQPTNPPPSPTPPVSLFRSGWWHVHQWFF